MADLRDFERRMMRHTIRTDAVMGELAKAMRDLAAIFPPAPVLQEERPPS